MRTFLRAHWKVLVAIVLLVLLALFTVNPSAAVPELPLASRLNAHVAAIASGGATRYVGNVLSMQGYAVRRQGADIEASVANVPPDTRPARVFIVGVNGNSDAGGAAAVLELARLLKDLHPSLGTEVKFVFLMGQDRGGKQPPGSFIAFAGSMASARLAQDALSAFRTVSSGPSRGLAAPAYVQGVTLSNRAAYKGAGYPAIMFTDTGFGRYPYYQMKENETQPDYEETARVVQGLARTITALAAAKHA